MNVTGLNGILSRVSVMYRKGAEVTEKTTKSGVQVTDVYLMDHVDQIVEEEVPVDVHFVTIGVNKKAAEKHRAELVSILDDYPDPQRLSGGPSYIEVGGAVGSQDLALMLFAVGKVLGFWDIVTPEILGFEGAEADEMAGRGLVMITGYNPEKK